MANRDVSHAPGHRGRSAGLAVLSPLPLAPASPTHLPLKAPTAGNVSTTFPFPSSLQTNSQAFSGNDLTQGGPKTPMCPCTLVPFTWAREDRSGANQMLSSGKLSPERHLQTNAKSGVLAPDYFQVRWCFLGSFSRLSAWKDQSTSAVTQRTLDNVFPSPPWPRPPRTELGTKQAPNAC